MGRPPNSKSLTFWEALDQFSPILVRLAARRPTQGKGIVGISSAEIAIEADIPLARVLEISRRFDWSDVTIGEARAFFHACCFDPTNPVHRGRQNSYLRTCQRQKLEKTPRWLTGHPEWETEFLPLIHLLKSRPNSSAAPTSTDTSNERNYAA